MKNSKWTNENIPNQENKTIIITGAKDLKTKSGDYFRPIFFLKLMDIL